MKRTRLGGIARRYGIDAIILFGSRARGDARPGSDLDLCVSAPRLRGNEARMIGDLAEALREDVDVCILERVGPALAHAVATQGRLLYGARVRFERLRLRAIKEWQDCPKYLRAVGAYLDRFLA